MKLIDKLAKQAVENQHSTIRKEFRIPSYEKGFRDGFEKAVLIIEERLGKEGLPISITHIVDVEVE